MAILNIFKKKKSEEKQEKPKERIVKSVEEQTEKQREVKKEKSSEGAISVAKTRKTKGTIWAYRILKTPHVSEKATGLTEKNQYVFKVWPGVNKFEIKDAVEDLYGVDVISVKIINVPRKKRRLGRISGWRKKYKKAIIEVKEGQKIEVLPR